MQTSQRPGCNKCIRRAEGPVRFGVALASETHQDNSKMHNAITTINNVIETDGTNCETHNVIVTGTLTLTVNTTMTVNLGLQDHQAHQTLDALMPLAEVVS